jgi:hypothetical protein
MKGKVRFAFFLNFASCMWLVGLALDLPKALPL